VIFAGEALDLRALQPWYRRHPDTRPQLVNMYGITETTVHTTYRHIRLADVTDYRGSVIGPALGDLECYILDSHRQPVPIGVPGELYVGGPGLGRGYLNRPELTAERFIDNPFRAGRGERLYKSGDLVGGSRIEVDIWGGWTFKVKIADFASNEEIRAVLNTRPSVGARVRGRAKRKRDLAAVNDEKETSVSRVWVLTTGAAANLGFANTSEQNFRVYGSIGDRRGRLSADGQRSTAGLPDSVGGCSRSGGAALAGDQF
jgi:acyl-CoA synthetase (AMP-forming)/AMP-acid ligase II